jgi:hypothetical protein
MGPCVGHGKCYRCSLRENANVMRAGMPSLNQKCASPSVFFLKEILALLFRGVRWIVKSSEW